MKGGNGKTPKMMQKLIPIKKSILLSFLMILLIFPVDFIQAESERGAVGITSVYDERRGSIFTVEIYAKNINKMASGQIKLEFDPSTLRAQEITQGEMLNGFLYVDDQLTRAQTGEIQAAWASASGVSGDGILLSIDFRLMTTNGESPLDLSKVRLFDEAGNEMNTLIMSGDVKPFSGAREKRETPVNTKKDWTVRFSSPVAPASVNNRTVYVLNSSGEKINTDLTVVQGGRAIKIEPTTSYEQGDYTLIVTEQLQSRTGTALKQAVKMEFNVKD